MKPSFSFLRATSIATVGIGGLFTASCSEVNVIDGDGAGAGASCVPSATCDCTAECPSSGTSPTSGSGTAAGGYSTASQTLIAEGTGELVDVLVGDALIFVVEVRRVAAFDPDGNLITQADWPRDIKSAAFDAGRLVIADQGLTTVLGADLGVVSTASVLEPCASVVLLGNRVVCGPEEDWERIFYTYDATTGALLSTSEPYTYQGVPMRRVPGADAFVTVTTNLSPSDFFLYEVAQSGAVTYVGESPYHGDFGAEDVYAFDGSPPTHLISHEGVMLSVFGSEPFVKDGDVGTLTETALFMGMDNDPSGKLYGFVDTDVYDSSYYNRCELGCLVQKIDVPTRTVEHEATYTLEVGTLIAARYQAVTDMLVVGYRLPGSDFPGDPYPGYRVERLSY